MKGFGFALALLLGAGLSHAVAADLVVADQHAPFNWSGAYLGGQVGGAWSESHGEFTTDDTFDAEPSGFIGGVYAGANYQFANKIVLGVDADFTFSDVEDTTRIVDPAGAAFPFDNRGRTELDWSAAIRGRMGFAVDRFLPYVAGGVAVGKVSYSTDNDILGTYSDGDDTYVGYTVGAGVEFAFTDRLIGRAEYRFTDFGNEDFGASALAAPISVDLKTNDLRIGLGYKF